MMGPTEQHGGTSASDYGTTLADLDKRVRALEHWQRAQSKHM